MYARAAESENAGVSCADRATPLSARASSDTDGESKDAAADVCELAEPDVAGASRINT